MTKAPQNPSEGAVLSEEAQKQWEAEKELWAAELERDPSFLPKIEAFFMETAKAQAEARELLEPISKSLEQDA